MTGVENLWFLPYDGSSKPFRRDGHNPLGVAVHGVTMQPGVTACRVGDPDQPVEEAVIEGRWYRCRWGVRPWDGGWDWPPVRELRLNGRWVKPVSKKRPMTRDFLVNLIVRAETQRVAWQLLDDLIEEDPALGEEPPGATWRTTLRRRRGRA